MSFISWKILGVTLAVLNPLIPTTHADVSIYPVKMHIQGENGERTATLNMVASADQKAKNYEVKVFRWTQDAQGQEVLTPDRSLVVNPLSFVLEPGSKRLIRMGFNQAVADMGLKEEAAWRILINPLPDHEKFTGIQYAYAFSIPVFVGMKFKPNMSFQISKDQENKATVIAKNQGKAHFQLTGLTLQNQAGQTLKNLEQMKYILANQQAIFNLNLPAFTSTQGLKLLVHTADSKTIHFDLSE